MTHAIRYFDCLCPACNDPKAELGKHAALCEEGNCNGQVSDKSEVDVLLTSFKVCVEPGTWQWTNCLACGENPSRELKYK